MTLADTLFLIAEIILILVCLITSIDYLRHRDRPRLDIALMFGTLGIPTVLIRIQDFLPDYNVFLEMLTYTILPHSLYGFPFGYRLRRSLFSHIRLRDPDRILFCHGRSLCSPKIYKRRFSHQRADRPPAALHGGWLHLYGGHTVESHYFNRAISRQR